MCNKRLNETPWQPDSDNTWCTQDVSVDDGPAVTLVRSSADRSMTARRRGSLHVDFVDHRTGNIFVQVCLYEAKPYIGS